MKLLRTIGGVAALAALTLVGCGGSSTSTSSSSARPKVGFVTNNPDPFWNIAQAGTKKAEKECGVEVVFRMPANGDPAVQKENIDTLLSQNIKAVAVSVIDPKGQKPYLDEIAARVPLLTQDNDAPDSKRLCYIGTNNYEAGREVGRLIKEVLPDGGVVAIFVGQLEPLNARQRRQGVLDELADKPAPADINAVVNSPDGQTYGKWKLHRTFTDQPGGAARARENTTDALTQLRDEKKVCLVGLWAYNPPANLSALRDYEGGARLGKVQVIGFDENDSTLDGIAEGYIHATVVQDPFNFGYESVKMMADIAKGDRSKIPANGLKYVPHRVITKDGGAGRIPVAKFRVELNTNLGRKK